MVKSQAESRVSVPEDEARQQFLRKASERILALSPTVSARLSAESIKLGNEILQDTSANTCLACGIFLIPGWSCRKAPKASSGRVKKPKSSPDHAPTPRSFQCDKCGTRTEMPSRKSVSKKHISPSLPSSQSKDQKPQLNESSSSIGCRVPQTAPASHPQQSPEGTQVSSPVPDTTAPLAPASNVASKKRARARKQGGLQALLAQRKTETATQGGSGGLDLMDFMKSV